MMSISSATAVSYRTVREVRLSLVRSGSRVGFTRDRTAYPGHSLPGSEHVTISWGLQSHLAYPVPAMWRRIFLSSMVVVSGCAADRGAVDRTQAERPVAPGAAARELLDRRDFAWQTLDAPNARIHTPRGAAVSRDAPELADSAELARQAALAILGESERTDEPKLELFFVDSRDDMQRLVGRPIGGFAQPG